MYIILRKDLYKIPGWTQGSIVAQAGHGVCKCIWKYGNHDSVKQYMADVDNMHKVVLELKNQNQLKFLGQQFTEANIDFVEWIEQPENQLTCIVSRPYEPEEIRPLLKKCSLFK
jgi:peptidyl-tRNA hydrolase